MSGRRRQWRGEQRSHAQAELHCPGQSVHPGQLRQTVTTSRVSQEITVRRWPAHQPAAEPDQPGHQEDLGASLC